MDEDEVHVIKALECLAGAESELALGRFNNAANRAYYACYHAAVLALLRGDFQRRIWTHDEVRSLFAGVLIRRLRLFPGAFRSILHAVAEVRITADYENKVASKSLAESVVRDARRFVREIIGVSA